MSKKYTVLRDELGIKDSDGGLYCIFPYEKLDKDKKGVFKIGYAVNFGKRMESYLTAYPTKSKN